MDFEVVWTEPALNDLQEVVAYIARQNTTAASRVGNEIVDRVETLRSFPFIGPTYPRGTHGKSQGDRVRQLPDFLPGSGTGKTG